MCGLLFVHLANYELRKMIEDAALLQMTCESGSLPPKGTLGQVWTCNTGKRLQDMIATGNPIEKMNSCKISSIAYLFL